MNVGISSQSVDNEIPDTDLLSLFEPTNQPLTKKRTHDENNLVVCICCLEKCKEKRPRKLHANESLCNQIAAIYPHFFQDIVYLPGIICQCCYDKLQSNQFSSAPVQFKELVKDVKSSKCFDRGFINSKHTDIPCEICKLASAKFKSLKSQYALQSKAKPGRRPDTSVQKPKPPVTDFFPASKNKPKIQALDKILDTVETSSMDQLAERHIERKIKANKNPTDPISLKRVHGYPRTLYPTDQSGKETVLSHSTLLKIRSEIQISGNKTYKLSQILRDDCEGLKIEENFREHQIKHNHKLDDFFDHKTCEMEIYELKDFQMWKMSNEGFLVDKIGNWQYKDKLLILPRVGVPGFIEEVESGHVLSVKNGASDVHLTPKITVTTKITRSTLKSAPKSDLRDLQKWVVGHADSEGWFRITHAKTGKYLTSNDVDSVTIETLKETKKNKKNLVKVQKTYVWCHKVEEFICYVAKERGYENENLKIEIGLDSGGDLLKLMMTVDEYKKSEENVILGASEENVILGEGEMCPPPKKKRKKGKYMNKYKPRGVKGVFLLGVVKHCPETYENFKLILKPLEDVGILNFAFVPDFKAKRICLGLQPCSATYPCSFCKGKSPFIEKAELRTFKNLNDDYEGYHALEVSIGKKGAKKFAKDYFSVTNKSLIKGDFENQRILFKVLIGAKYLLSVSSRSVKLRENLALLNVDFLGKVWL